MLFYFYFIFIHFMTVKIKCDVWYTIKFIDFFRVVHLKIPIQAITHRIWLVQFIPWLYILCWNHLTGWFNGLNCPFSPILKNYLFYVPFLISLFIIWILWFILADNYSKRGHSVSVKYWVSSVSIFMLRTVHLLEPMALHV